MTELNERLRRFDEAFRTLLIIVTITMTFSLNFYRESLTNFYFIGISLFFIISVLLWCFFHLFRGNNEYFWKLLAWHFLTENMVIAFYGIIKVHLIFPEWVEALGFAFYPQLIATTLVALFTFKLMNWFNEVNAFPTGYWRTCFFAMVLGSLAGLQAAIILS